MDLCKYQTIPANQKICFQFSVTCLKAHDIFRTLIGVFVRVISKAAVFRSTNCIKDKVNDCKFIDYLLASSCEMISHKYIYYSIVCFQEVYNYTKIMDR